MNKTQVNFSNISKKILEKIWPIKNYNDLIKIHNYLFNNIDFYEYDDNSKEHEKLIRWKRTGEEILKDNFVYKTKSCTDLVIVFIKLCNAAWLKTKFVKVKKNLKIHSIAEVKINKTRYICDISVKECKIVEWKLSKENDFFWWKLYKKWIDSWDIGLEKYDDIIKYTSWHLIGAWTLPNTSR